MYVKNDVSNICYYMYVKNDVRNIDLFGRVKVNGKKEKCFESLFSKDSKKKVMQFL